MANITYTPAFRHDDWIDNEDVVQAGGEKGFNKKFHDLENEFGKIETVVGKIDTEIKKIQRLVFVKSEPRFKLRANSGSSEFEIEKYDRSNLPEDVEKAYFVVIFPFSSPTYIQHTLLYRPLPGNQIAVSVQFFNPGTLEAEFSFRVLTLAVQT